MTATVTLSGEDPERDLRALLRVMRDGGSPVWLKTTRQIVKLLRAASQRAFVDQRFGTSVWPPRYPNQQIPPFANVAGIVADFNRGMNAPSRRFEKRPALRDTGEMLNRLRGSASASFGDFEVTYKSDVPYADTHQTGGKSTQPVSPQAKTMLKKLLKRRPELRPRLRFLLTIDELETEVNERPFIGVTEETKPKIVSTVERNLSGKPWEV